MAATPCARQVAGGEDSDCSPGKTKPGRLPSAAIKRLHLAAIHLHRARLFGIPNVEFRVSNEGAAKAAPYPWESPVADLAAAEKLISDCGYHRRDEELAKARKVILGS